MKKIWSEAVLLLFHFCPAIRSQELPSVGANNLVSSFIVNKKGTGVLVLTLDFIFLVLVSKPRTSNSLLH